MNRIWTCCICGTTNSFNLPRTSPSWARTYSPCNSLSTTTSFQLVQTVESMTSTHLQMVTCSHMVSTWIETIRQSASITCSIHTQTSAQAISRQDKRRQTTWERNQPSQKRHSSFRSISVIISAIWNKIKRQAMTFFHRWCSQCHWQPTKKA